SNRRRGAGGGGVGRGGPPRPRRTRARAPHARARAACRRDARPGSLASPSLRLLDLPRRTPRFLRFAIPRGLWLAPETGRTTAFPRNSPRERPLLTQVL